MMNKLFKIFLTSLTLFLSSCCYEQCPPQRIHFDNPCDKISYCLQKEGVHVIKRGDTLRIIIPADLIFYPATTQVKLDKDMLLYQVAALTVCQCHAFMPIRVNGYTDNIGSIRQQKYRSLRQARNVAAYLWFAGIPLNRITVRGYGARGSMASNETPRGEACNRRVEVLIP